MIQPHNRFWEAEMGSYVLSEHVCYNPEVAAGALVGGPAIEPAVDVGPDELEYRLSATACAGRSD